MIFLLQFDGISMVDMFVEWIKACWCKWGAKNNLGAFNCFFNVHSPLGKIHNLYSIYIYIYLFQTGWNQLISSQYLGMKSISEMATNLTLIPKRPKLTHCILLWFYKVLGEFHCDLTRPKSSKGFWHRRKSRNRTWFEILICLHQSPLFHKLCSLLCVSLVWMSFVCMGFKTWDHPFPEDSGSDFHDLPEPKLPKASSHPVEEFWGHQGIFLVPVAGR